MAGVSAGVAHCHGSKARTLFMFLHLQLGDDEHPWLGSITGGENPPPSAVMDDELVCVLPAAFCARVTVVRLMKIELVNYGKRFYNCLWIWQQAV